MVFAQRHELLRELGRYVKHGAFVVRAQRQPPNLQIVLAQPLAQKRPHVRGRPDLRGATRHKRKSGLSAVRREQRPRSELAVPRELRERGGEHLGGIRAFVVLARAGRE